VEGFFFGLYSGIFAMYLQHYGLQQSTNKANNILFYALSVLYALTVAVGIIDILGPILVEKNIEFWYHRQIIQVTTFACCDFISQFILIYRCWIVWGYSIRAVIVPSFLAFAFLVIWIAQVTGSEFITAWNTTLVLTGLTLSMTVNALVTGLIVFRIFKVFQQVKTSTANNRTLGVTGGSRLRRVIFLLIESGMALFSIQLARLVVTIVWGTSDAVYDAFELIVGIHEMLNGITPTIILVRVSMGLSGHDKSSMVEATSSIGGVLFAHDDPDPIPEAAGIDILDEGRKDDDIEIQLKDDSDIQMNCGEKRR